MMLTAAVRTARVLAQIAPEKRPTPARTGDGTADDVDPTPCCGVELEDPCLGGDVELVGGQSDDRPHDLADAHEDQDDRCGGGDTDGETAGCWCPRIGCAGRLGLALLVLWDDRV